MRAALWSESVKLLRSRTPWVTGVAFIVPVLLAAVFVRASMGGALGGKAEVLGITPDWAGFHTVLMQVDAAGGFLLFGAVLAWTFGREFSERTVMDLLALPTSRGAIVLAKFVVAACWLAAISLLQAVAWLVTGWLLGLPGTFGQGLGGLATLLAFNIVLAFPIALAASAGRGYTRAWARPPRASSAASRSPYSASAPGSPGPSPPSSPASPARRPTSPSAW